MEAKSLKFHGRISFNEECACMDIIDLVWFAAIIVSIFFFALGSIFDIRTREVDDWVWLVYGPIGLALTIIRLFLDPSTLFITLISIALTTIFSFGLFYFGLFGGADAKAVICLGLTLPLIPTGLYADLGLRASFLSDRGADNGFPLLGSADSMVWTWESCYIPNSWKAAV